MVNKSKLNCTLQVPILQKSKGSVDARKHASESMKAFFSDPENRRKRSISMKGMHEVAILTHLLMNGAIRVKFVFITGKTVPYKGNRFKWVKITQGVF